MSSRQTFKRDINRIKDTTQLDKFKKYPVISFMLIFKILIISTGLYLLRPSEKLAFEFRERKNINRQSKLNSKLLYNDQLQKKQE